MILAGSKKKVASGNFRRRSLAQFDGVRRGRTVVVGLEGNQDIAVAGAHGADIAERQVETAERDADVVDDGVDFVRWDDVPDLIVDLGK